MKQIVWRNVHAYFLLFYLGLCTFPSSFSVYRITPRAGGRLGDWVIAYCKALYYSQETGIPITLPHIDHASAFLFYEQEEQVGALSFDRTVVVKKPADIKPLRGNILFVVDLFTPLSAERDFGESDFFVEEICEKMAQKPAYAARLKHMLQPSVPYTKVPIFNDGISVAVHIRRGSGADMPLFSQQLYTSDEANMADVGKRAHHSCAVDVGFPLKFPPEQFFVDQINGLAKLLPTHVLHFCIFTDDAYPEELLERIKKNCPITNGDFSLSNAHVWHEKIEDDLFAMTHFDCLIRSCSHFGGIAQIMGDYKLIVSPTKFAWHNKCLVIHEVALTFRDKKTQTMRRGLLSTLDDVDKEYLNACLDL